MHPRGGGPSRGTRPGPHPHTLMLTQPLQPHVCYRHARAIGDDGCQCRGEAMPVGTDVGGGALAQPCGGEAPTGIAMGQQHWRAALQVDAGIWQCQTRGRDDGALQCVLRAGCGVARCSALWPWPVVGLHGLGGTTREGVPVSLRAGTWAGQGGTFLHLSGAAAAWHLLGCLAAPAPDALPCAAAAAGTGTPGAPLCPCRLCGADTGWALGTTFPTKPPAWGGPASWGHGDVPRWEGSILAIPSSPRCAPAQPVYQHSLCY